MDQIVSEFKPEYLTIGDKVETAVLGWQEKVGMTLDPSQKKGLADRATFFQKTFDSVNRTIRDMTGAQMNEHEAGRLMRGMPNQDDSPTEFMAKMQSVPSARSRVTTGSTGKRWAKVSDLRVKPRLLLAQAHQRA